MDLVLGDVEKPFLNNGNSKTDGNKSVVTSKVCCNPENHLAGVHKKIIYYLEHKAKIRNFLYLNCIEPCIWCSSKSFTMLSTWKKILNPWE